MTLDNYFKKFSKNLTYLELKDSSNFQMLKGISLPVYIDEVKKGILSGAMEEEIKVQNFFDGMIINLAIDPDFIYNDKYKLILDKYIDDFAKYTTNQALQAKDRIKAILLLRGGFLLNPLDSYNSYLYARNLWPLAFEISEDYKDEFIKKSIEILEDIIKRNENFAPSYFELGNIYTNLGRYIKAKSYYNKALQKTDSIEAIDEIRDKISEIEDNAQIEEALYFIGKSRYDEAIRTLTHLLSNAKRADAYYYLGVSYQNLGQYENSIMAFENAIDLGGNFRELYNDYAISLYLKQKLQQALEVIDKGLKLYPSDPRLSYNKIQINLVLGNLNQAQKDIEELLSFDDLSDEIGENLSIIKEQFKI